MPRVSFVAFISVLVVALVFFVQSDPLTLNISAFGVAEHQLSLTPLPGGDASDVLVGYNQRLYESDEMGGKSINTLAASGRKLVIGTGTHNNPLYASRWGFVEPIDGKLKAFYTRGDGVVHNLPGFGGVVEDPFIAGTEHDAVSACGGMVSHHIDDGQAGGIETHFWQNLSSQSMGRSYFEGELWRNGAKNPAGVWSDDCSKLAIKWHSIQWPNVLVSFDGGKNFVVPLKNNTGSWADISVASAAWVGDALYWWADNIPGSNGYPLLSRISQTGQDQATVSVVCSNYACVYDQSELTLVNGVQYGHQPNAGLFSAQTYGEKLFIVVTGRGLFVWSEGEKARFVESKAGGASPQTQYFMHLDYLHKLLPDGQILRLQNLSEDSRSIVPQWDPVSRISAPAEFDITYGFPSRITTSSHGDLFIATNTFADLEYYGENKFTGVIAWWAPGVALPVSGFEDVVPSQIYVVDTIAQARELTGLRVGDVIEVAGYYVAGDGGGGVFDVTSSGKAPDGGLVFATNSASSAVQSLRAPNLYTFSLGEQRDQDLIYGSVDLRMKLVSSDEIIFEASDTHFHDHRWLAKEHPLTYFNYEASSFFDLRRVLRSFCFAQTGTYDGCYLEADFRTTTSDLRFERRVQGSEMVVDWFGTKLSSQDSAFDNQPVIAHAINVASKENSLGAQYDTILLSRLGTYPYFGSIQLFEGFTLKGAGAVDVVEDSDEFGNVFFPVRRKAQFTRLRVIDAQALRHLLMLQPSSAPFYEFPDTKWVLQTRPTAIYVGSGVMSAGLEDIVLDGNWEGNTVDLLNDEKYPADIRVNWLRNAPGWSGFVSTVHNGVIVPPHQEIVIRNVEVTGFGAAPLLGHKNNVWRVDNALLGDSLLNHVLYQTSGYFRNITMAGFAHGFTALFWGDFKNVVYRLQPGRVGVNDFYHSNQIIGIRGVGRLNDQDAREIPNHFFQLTDGSHPPFHGVKIDGFYFDTRGTNLLNVLGGVGPENSIRNGVIISNNAGPLWREVTNGPDFRRYMNHDMENITYVLLSGVPGEGLIQRHVLENSYFRNIMPRHVVGSQFARLVSVHNENDMRWRGVAARPAQIVYQSIGSKTNPFRLKLQLLVYWPDHNTVSQAFFDDIHVRNPYNNILAFNSGDTSSQADYESNRAAVDATQLYWSNSEFRIPFGSSNNVVFWEASRFHNVRNYETGHTSEDHGTAMCDGTSSLSIPTNLLWQPHSTLGDFVVEGGPAVLSVSYEVVSPVDRRAPTARIQFVSVCSVGTVVSWSGAVSRWLDHEGNEVIFPSAVNGGWYPYEQLSENSLPLITREITSSWSLFSIPTMRSGYTAAELFGTSSIVRDVNGLLYLPALGINDLGAIDPGQAYWTRSDADIDLVLVEQGELDKIRNLNPGWNLVSIPSIELVSVSIPSDVIIRTRTHTIYANGAAQNGFSWFDEGEGYFIYSPTAQLISW